MRIAFLTMRCPLPLQLTKRLDRGKISVSTKTGSLHSVRSRRFAREEAASWGPISRRRGKLAVAALMSSLVLLGVFVAGGVMPYAGADDRQYEEFYTPPDPLPPGQPGDLIRTEPSRLALEPSGQLGAYVGTGTRIMYRSTDAQGNPVAVTGTYIEPDVPWPGNGPRPLLAYATGPYGAGEQCAPSRLFNQGIHFSQGFDLTLNVEEGWIATMLARGFAIVVTDGVGMGIHGPQSPQWLNREAAGTAMLDAARAAMKLPDTSLDPHGPVAFWGYASGGQASLFLTGPLKTIDDVEYTMEWVTGTTIAACTAISTTSHPRSTKPPTTLKPRRPSPRRLNYEAGIKAQRFIQECPMIKVFGYLKRKPGLSPQQFADYYEHNHVPLVLSKAFMPMVYKRNYIQRGDALNIEGNEIGFDCMTELVFADRDDLSAWMASLAVDEIARDEENFIDRAATRAYVVDERSTSG
jgi:uncharacterized protein (TIGR02118 family)